MSDHNHGEARALTLREIVRRWANAKFNRYSKENKQPLVSPTAAPMAPMGIEINSLAVVLDGRVEEVLRAQNRLAALFLSGPEFVQFDPEVEQPTIGWLYENGVFSNPNDSTNKEQNTDEKETD
jgi:hypothetical protein